MPRTPRDSHACPSETSRQHPHPSYGRMWGHSGDRTPLLGQESESHVHFPALLCGTSTSGPGSVLLNLAASRGTRKNPGNHDQRSMWFLCLASSFRTRNESSRTSSPAGIGRLTERAIGALLSRGSGLLRRIHLVTRPTRFTFIAPDVEVTECTWSDAIQFVHLLWYLRDAGVPFWNSVIALATDKRPGICYKMHCSTPDSRFILEPYA